MLVGWGWNGMESDQMPEAPRLLTEIAKNPDELKGIFRAALLTSLNKSVPFIRK